MRIPPRSFGFVVFCAALMALPSLSIDIGLPAFSEVGKAFGVDPSRLALSLTWFFVGFSIAPLSYGPLSDRIGRRPVLLAGCTIYAVGSIFCTLSASLESLLAWRLVQGVGAGAGSVLALSLVRDHFDGARARVLYSYIAVIRVISPMIAPTIGAVLLEGGGWRWIYGFMALGGVAVLAVVFLGLEESAPRFTEPDYKPASVWQSYKSILGNATCVGYMTVLAFGFGSQLAYVTGSSLSMMAVFGLSAHAYAISFGMAAFGTMLASFVNGRLNARGVAPSTLIAVGLTMALLSALVMFGLTMLGAATAMRLIPLLVLSAFCFGLVMPNAQQAVLQPVPNISGAAAALLNATIMIVGAFASYIVETASVHGAVMAMTATMAVFSTLAWVAFFLMRIGERARLTATAACAVERAV
jgi:MFS transporter, DHA1 family, multidrug resistance protein